MKDGARSHRLTTKKVARIITEVERDRYVSSHNIAKELNVHRQTVFNYLKGAGYKKKLDGTSIRYCPG